MCILLGGNLPIDPILCKLGLKSKNFNEEAKYFDNIFNKWNNYMNPQRELQNTLLIEGFFTKIFLF